MKLKRFYPLVLFISVAALATADILSDNGKAGKTGSPGETTCISCHNSYNLNAGAGSITIGATNMPNWQYIPGQVYHLTVTVTRSANSLFGFGFEALKATGNTPAGTFTITNAASTTIKNATISGVTRPNVVHTLNGGASSGSKVFSFDWTAPSTNVGNIVFYTSGNACNNNGGESGDYVYSSSQTITPANTTSVDQVDNNKVSLKMYPNPVVSEFTIDYFLNEPAYVELSVLNTSGANVLTLLRENQNGGAYSEQFTIGNKIAKGVYLVSLQVGSTKTLKKLIVQ
jgi:Secretion system C-terminal sorting domain/Reeler domain